MEQNTNEKEKRTNNTMDFDLAAQKLQRDQSRLAGRRHQPALSVKATQEAARQKRLQESRLKERQRVKQQREDQETLLRAAERNQNVKALGNLRPTSIWGLGDKIALPPSVLEQLTSNMPDEQRSQPWTFRIGIVNPNYEFPASESLKQYAVQEDDDDTMSDDDEEDTQTSRIYLDELSHKYLCYTHATVVEFTQEDGHVGLPEPIATALLRSGALPSSFRTVDPAGDAAMDDQEDDDDERTPGHLAYGAFDLPDAEIEITLLTLPKGKSARLLPSQQAIRDGFYNLKDIKLVLEQSLIRTRATLSVTDVISTWHRGKKYDLTVTTVSPSTYHAVSIINTDIEIEFDSADLKEANEKPSSDLAAKAQPTEANPLAASAGRRLNDATPAPLPSSSTPSQTTSPPPSAISLRPEPPLDQADNVTTVQLRGPGGTKGQRRFDISLSTMGDLFAFARTVVPFSNFQLVTRFPRRVFSNQETSKTLKDAGIATGQELFMVEPLE